ncbi:MAG: CBS domain-containing protein [Acidimicrobiia bacterium]|jgi:CBS domain-containing protein
MINRTVKQILGAKGYQLYSVGGEAPVLDALRQMADRNIGALVVIDDDELVGVVTERDCARKLDLEGRTPADTRVAEIMERRVTTVSSDATVEHCLRLMTDLRVRHLPVVDEEPVGLISIGDVGKSLISDQGHLIDELTGYITGSPR